jgi:hypothetical protein
MYNRKIAPTVSKIKKEIEDTIKISKSTLTLTLLDLGYKYKKSGGMILINPGLIQIYIVIPILSKLPDFWEVITPIIYYSVYRVVNGKSSPESNRPKERKKTLDDFNRCVIKWTIHSMYNRKIAPTVSKIKKEIEDTIKISKSTFSS